ncbi:RNA polymerase subunit sigma-24 [Opitutaceae bacterium TAV5]|nr:RNA polymerase subunit sigma-24 [Opitutaceae bacterium TAV5]
MKPEFSSDEELIAALRNSDEHALQLLLKRYHVTLSKFAFLILKRRDLAQEASTNVFVNIWCRRRSLLIKTSLRSYLYSAVSNQALKLLSRQPKHEPISLEEVSPEELADTRRTDTELLFKEFEAQIEDVLSRMPDQRRLIFRMSKIDGMLYKEIADTLNISEWTVQNHMVQANRQIAEALPEFRANWLNRDTEDR